MTNILTALPDFDLKPYSHILPSLEKALITASDLLTLEPLHVAKRAQVPLGEVKKLTDALLTELANDRPFPAKPTLPDSSGHGAQASSLFRRGEELIDQWTISTLDDTLDAALNGGVHSGYLTEITGESAVGKTQFLLTLLLSVQLSDTPESGKTALYVSTEAQLQTTRLNQILRNHPKLSAFGEDQGPSLARIQSTHTHDLESQEHILRYQVPVAIKRFNVGLVVIDSIAANYRAEFDKGKAGKGAQSLAKRSTQIAQLGTLLRNIAREHNIAIVVANQVADRFEPQGQIAPLSQSTQRSRPASPPHIPNISSTNLSPATRDDEPSNPAALLSTDDPLALDHQQCFFTGWGDDPSPSAPMSNLKTPSLGLTWTNQLATRIALLRDPIYEDRAYRPGEDKVVAGWKRTMKVVFSAWCPSGSTEYEIWQGGVRGLPAEAA